MSNREKIESDAAFQARMAAVYGPIFAEFNFDPTTSSRADIDPGKWFLRFAYEEWQLMLATREALIATVALLDKNVQPLDE